MTMPEDAKPFAIKARWPELMDTATLAEYLCCSIPMIGREVARGGLPEPIVHAGRKKWRKEVVDRHLDGLTGNILEPWEARFLRGDKAA